MRIRLARMGSLISLAVALAMLMMLVRGAPVSAAVGTITVTPTAGPVATTVGITGTGFSAGATSYTIYFDSNQIIFGSVASGNFTASFVIPPATAGAHNITATTNAADTSNTVTFTVSPQITLSAASGHVGDSLTISGEGFGASTTVTLYIDSASIASTSTGSPGTFSVSFNIPASITGNHTITATDTMGNTDAATYTVSPQVSISPSAPSIGTTVTVTGSGFAASSIISFYIDGTVVSSNAASTNSAGSFASTGFVIPAISGGSHTFQARDSTSSASVSFSITASTVLSPTSGTAGATVQITGKGFTPNRTITLRFDGIIVSTSPSLPSTDVNGNFTITFLVPTTFGGAHQVTITDGTYSATATYTLQATANLSTVYDMIGNSVTVSGSGFAANGVILVTFDGIALSTINADASGAFTVNFVVPPTPTGTHTVTVSDGTRNIPFSFSTTPKLSSSPNSGHVGQTISVTGDGFSSKTGVTVKFDNIQVTSANTDISGSFSATFNAPAVPGGNHTITVTDGTSTMEATFVMESTAPPVPSPIAPPNDTKADAMTTFGWSEVSDPSGVTYELQVSRDPNFSTTTLDKKGLTTPGYQLSESEALPTASKNQPYYWRVRAIDGAFNASAWSPNQSFFVGFVLASWALYTIFGILIIATGLAGFWLGRRQ